jgi:hypothetical protein
LLLSLFLFSCGPDVFAADAFNYDRSGWELEGQTFESRPRLDKFTGNPTGNICAKDDPNAIEDRPWRFVAPPAYTGNASAFYGRRVTWDAKTTDADPQFIINNTLPPEIDNAIFIGTGTGDAGFVIGAPPDNNATAATLWTSLSVTLDTSSAWTYPLPDGGTALATEDDVRRVLSALNLFNIRGEWSRDEDEGCIDNIAFGAR